MPGPLAVGFGMAGATMLAAGLQASNLKAIYDATADELAGKTEDLHIMEIRLQKMKEDRDDVWRDLDSTASVLAETRQRVEVLRREKRQLVQEKAELSTRIRTAKVSKREVETKLDAALLSSERQQTELEALRPEVEALRVSKSQLAGRNMELQADLEAVQDKLQLRVEELASLQAQIAEQRAQAQELDAKVQQREMYIEQLQSKAQDQQSLLQQLQSTLEDNSTLYELEISLALRDSNVETLETLESNANLQQAEMQQLRDHLFQLERNLEERKVAAEELQVERKADEKRMQDQEALITQHEKELQKRKAALRLKDAQVAGLQADAAVQHTQLEQATVEVRHLKTDKQQLETKARQQHMAIQELQESKVKAEQRDVETAALHAKMQQQQQECLTEKEEMLDNSRQEVVAAKQNFRLAQEELLRNNTTIQKMKANARKHGRTVSTLQECLTEKEEMLEDNQLEVAAAKQESRLAQAMRRKDKDLAKVQAEQRDVETAALHAKMQQQQECLSEKEEMLHKSQQEVVAAKQNFCLVQEELLIQGAQMVSLQADKQQQDILIKKLQDKLLRRNSTIQKMKADAQKHGRTVSALQECLTEKEEVLEDNQLEVAAAKQESHVPQAMFRKDKDLAKMNASQKARQQDFEQVFWPVFRCFLTWQRVAWQAKQDKMSQIQDAQIKHSCAESVNL